MTTENQLLIAVRLLQKIDSEFTVDPARVAFLRGRGVAFALGRQGAAHAYGAAGTAL